MDILLHFALKSLITTKENQINQLISHISKATAAAVEYTLTHSCSFSQGSFLVGSLSPLLRRLFWFLWLSSRPSSAPALPLWILASFVVAGLKFISITPLNPHTSLLREALALFLVTDAQDLQECKWWCVDLNSGNLTSASHSPYTVFLL